ncbi:MAG: hypothetical protein R3F07_13565 [Opitutaceae bacterium]
MLAVKLHRTRCISLGRGARLVPVVSWDAAHLHIGSFVQAGGSRARYASLVRIPADLPVRFCFWYGESNQWKRLYLDEGYVPLGDRPNEVKRAVAAFWDARQSSAGRFETGGLLVEEPVLVLGAPLGSGQILWTKDLRLLHRRRF